MKRRHLTKKIGSLVLAAAMIITSFPAFGTEVQAAEAGSAAPGQFVTKGQLKTFNTDDTDGKNPARVYFGKNNGNNQKWWIAGSQKADSVTLFAASPLATGQKFDSNYVSDNSNTATKSYSADWGCKYSEGTNIENVNANHYGASTLRNALKRLETSCFSTAEQALMQETTLYTNDTKNSTDTDKRINCAYSTTDKLYPAYGEFSGQYITVGENASGDLNNGLRIDKEYWGSRNFWLRAPNHSNRYIARVAVPGSSVSNDGVSHGYAVVPAFELNLSSVLFASAAKAASSETTNGTIADGTAMTLRLDGGDKTIGTVSYDAEAGRIVAQKDTEAAGTVSLVVQGRSETGDWYYSVPAGESTVVSKEQIQAACSISGLNLAECKIWLETTEVEDSFAYAKMAEAKNFNDAVTLAPGQTLVRDDETITNGQDGTVTIDKGNDGNVVVTVKLPQAGNVDIDADGTVTVPAGATVQAAGGKELTLPNGGTVDADGNVEAEKIVSGDTTVTAPEGGKVTADKDGKITVPAGGTVQSGDGTVTTLPNGGSVDKDGNVEADKIVNGDTTVTAPEGGSLTADKAGNITVPAGGKVETGDGKELTLPNGGTVDKDEKVEADKIVSGDTTVTAPEGGKVTADKDGKITVPAGGTVDKGGTVTTLPNGGSVDKDGNVEADKIVNGDTTVTAPEGGSLTADKAGNITVPAGGKVETGDGKELTLPNGGTVDKDEKVEADKIVSGDTTVTAPEGGKVTADKDGKITVPAGGTVDKGGTVTTLPNGGTVDKDGTISQTPPQTPNPPSNLPSNPPTNPPANPGGTVSPEEVAKNSEKLNSGVSAGWKGNSFRLGWQAVPGAEGYDIFADRCGKKLGKKSLIKTVKGNKTSVSLAKIAGKKLSGRKNYKVRIKAWKQVDGKKVYIGSSKTYHVAGRKHKKYTNAKKLIPKKKKYTLRKGENASLKVRIVKQSKKKKLLPNGHGAKLRYFSDNKEVVTVTSKGKVKAKGQGTCYVYVTALNGISVKIKITVK